MDAKTICIQQLAHLSTATIMGRKAPHKAVLLLAIMDLVETGIIVMPQFVLSEQLEETFKKEWYRYIGSPLIFKCKVSTPFWHMQNEPFTVSSSKQERIYPPLGTITLFAIFETRLMQS